MKAVSFPIRTGCRKQTLIVCWRWKQRRVLCPFKRVKCSGQVLALVLGLENVLCGRQRFSSNGVRVCVCSWWQVQGAPAGLDHSTPIRSERWEDGWAVGTLRQVFSIWLQMFNKRIDEASRNGRRTFQCYSIKKKKTLEIYLRSETDKVLTGSNTFYSL